MKLSDAGIALIKSFEQCRLDAYPDPGTGGEPITIGWGHTGGVRMGDSCSQGEADAWFRKDAERFEQCVEASIFSPITQSQFDACVSLAFNIGCDAFRRSTLAKKINDADNEGAAAEFLRWNKSGGKVLAGLTRRRQAEMDLFLS